MKQILKFKRIENDKDVNELRYTLSIWHKDLSFLNTELNFMRTLLKFSSFSNNIQNLFERIQLSLKEIETLEEENSDLIKSIEEHDNKLYDLLKSNELTCGNTYSKEHENLAEIVFHSKEKYRHFKSNFIEYISSIIQ